MTITESMRVVTTQPPMTEPRSESTPSVLDAVARVGVRAPYAALRDVDSLEAGTMVGSTVARTPDTGEVGPMASDQALRHLGVLGATAAAHWPTREGRQMFLLRHAVMTRRPMQGVADGATLVASAIADLDVGTAQASTVLHGPGGESLFHAEIGFDIVPAALFDRVYRIHRQHQPVQRVPDPHERAPGFDVRHLDGQMLRGAMVPRSADCAGHFWCYPVVPPSRMLGAFTRGAGEILRFRLGRADLAYGIDRVEMTTEHLAFAGAPVSLSVRYLRSASRSHFFRCRALGEAGAVYAAATIELREEG